MHGICTGNLKVHAIEYVLLVALGMDDLELRGIQEAARVQAVRRDEIAPLRPPKRHVKAPVHRAKLP